MTATVRRTFGAEAALLAAARLSTVATIFGVNVLGARLLDPAALGAAAIGQTIGTIAALVANGGLNIAAIYLLQREPDDRRLAVPRFTGLATLAATLAIALVIVTAPIVLGWVAGGMDWGLVLSAAAFGATMIAFEVVGALLLGLGRAGSFTLMEVVRGAGSLAAVAILLVGPLRDDSGFVLGLALGYALAAALGLVRSGRDGMPLVPRWDAPFARRALGFGLRGQAGNVFQFLGVRVDLLIVPALLDLRAAGIYVIAVRTSDVVGQVATAVSSLVFPRVAAEADSRATRFTERAVRMTLIAVAVPAILIGLAAEPILGLLFGEAYTVGTSTLHLLLLAVVPLSLGRVLAADLKGRGRPGLASWASLLSAGATVALDLALVPALGLVGAGLASLLAYLASTAVLLLTYRAVTGGSLGALVPTPTDIRDAVAAGSAILRTRRRPA